MAGTTEYSLRFIDEKVKDWCRACPVSNWITHKIAGLKWNNLHQRCSGHVQFNSERQSAILHPKCDPKSHRKYLIRLGRVLFSRIDRSPRERSPINEVAMEVPSVIYVRKRFESSVNEGLAHCQHGLLIVFARHSTHSKQFFDQRDKFWLINHNESNDAPARNIGIIWNPWRFPKTVGILCLEGMVLFSTSGVLSSMLSICGLEHIRNTTNSRPRW
jgi:hypothetical protein